MIKEKSENIESIVDSQDIKKFKKRMNFLKKCVLGTTAISLVSDLFLYNADAYIDPLTTKVKYTSLGIAYAKLTLFEKYLF